MSLNYILYYFNILQNGSNLLKIQLITMTALLISPLVWVFETYMDWHANNSEYVGFVLGAIAVDHILGTLYHAFWLRDFTFKKNVKGLLVKLALVVAIGYLFEGLDVLMTEDTILKSYTVVVLRLMVFLYPSSSAFANSYEMTGHKFPPLGFMKHIKKFNENAKIGVSDDSNKKIVA